MNYSSFQKPSRVPGPALAIICFLLVGILFNVLGYVLTRYFNWRSLWVSALAQILIIAGIPLLLALVSRVNFKSTFSFRKINLNTLALCVIIGLVTQFAVRFPDLLARLGLQWIFGPLYLPEDSGVSDGTIGGMLLATLALLVLAPTCEELLNRGFLMSGFHRHGNTSFWRTVLFTGFFFGLFHQYMYTFVGTALGGIMLAYVALSTGSIFAAMAAHFGFNLFPTVVYWVLLFVDEQELLGESVQDYGLSIIEPEFVTSSIVISLTAGGLLFLLLRAVTRQAIRKRTGLVIGYSGLVKDYFPNLNSHVQGEYYGPAWPYLYGYHGYTVEHSAPIYWQASGIDRPGAPYDRAKELVDFATTRPPLPSAGRYLLPRQRTLPQRVSSPRNIPALIALTLVLLAFAFTSLAEVNLRAKGRECEQNPRNCTTVRSEIPDDFKLIIQK